MKTTKIKIFSLVSLLASALAAQSTVVRFETNFGDIDIKMKDVEAPLNVQNFLNYVNEGDYDNSIIHSSEPGYVIKGGALFSSGGALVDIPANDTVDNEFDLSNVRATMAMDKLNNEPNSATNNFFFNLRDNSGDFDNQNGGYTVFGEVVAGMNVVDLIGSLQVSSSVPLYGYKPGDSVELSNYVYINRAFVLSDEFQINAGLSGAYFNPTTNGQGIYLEVLPDQFQVVMAWFTYDTVAPDDLTPSDIGYAGGRWLTAVGNFEGNGFLGTVYESSGGIFENGSPVSNTEVGTVNLTFNNCAEIIMSYSLYSATINGITNLQRISDSNIALCEQLSNAVNLSSVKLLND